MIPANISAAAVLVHDLSLFAGVFDAGPIVAVLKVKTIKERIRDYFKAFAHAGHHIIHSTPVFEGVTETRLTATMFQVVSKTITTIKNVIQTHDSSVIVVCSMTHNRPLPTITVEWSDSLTLHGGNSICFGYNSFLKKSLMARLALINARTTVVPRYPTDHEDEWKVYLTTWDKHSRKKNQASGFKLVGGSKDSSTLKYQWDHLDVWSHEHHGSHEVSGKYKVNCKCLRIKYMIYSLIVHDRPHYQHAPHPDHSPQRRLGYHSPQRRLGYPR
jgi:hypothetical protein